MDNFKEKGTKYLFDRAKKGEDIIRNDTDYYICIGCIWKHVLKTGKVVIPISQRSLNLLLNANTDVQLKNRFKQIKVRENPLYLKDNWKGNILDAILSYEPIEKKVRGNYEVNEKIMLGYFNG